MQVRAVYLELTKSHKIEENTQCDSEVLFQRGAPETMMSDRAKVSKTLPLN